MHPNDKPTAKVATGGIAGAITILLVYIAGQAGIELPPEVGAAAATVIAFIAAYLREER